MNNYKYLVFLILFILLPNVIFAGCASEEIEHFKEIEDDYKITYEFNKDSKKYMVTLYTPEPNMYEYYIYASDNEFSNCEYLNDHETKCNSVNPNEYKIEIIGQTTNCNDVFKTIRLNLAKYNPYSEDSICEGIEDFVLCQPTYDKDIDYNTFVSRVTTYKKTLSKNTNLTNNKGNDINRNAIIQYLKENMFQIIIITIFIIMVVITVILTTKSAKKSRRLE